MIATLILSAALSACTVTDGDTIRCGEERIRLLGIDAPELPGHCRRGRACAPGDGAASKRSLAGRIQPGLSIERVSRDRYGRTLAIVRAGRTNLSCAQLRAGQAIYKRAWDNGGRVRRACPEAAR